MIARSPIPPFTGFIGTTTQWLFNKRRIFAAHGAAHPGYLSFVISGARDLVDHSNDDLLEIVLADLHAMIPASREAKVLKALVLKEKHATIAPDPASDLIRPPVATPIPNVFLAGDWIQTGLPATIESAVLSGTAMRPLRTIAARASRLTSPATKCPPQSRWLPALTASSAAMSCAPCSKPVLKYARSCVRTRTSGRSKVSIANMLSADLRDATSIAEFAHGCDTIYHVAADYRLWVPDPAPMYAANVEGTRNIFEAGRRAKVKRIVHTSTVGALGIVFGGSGREDTPVRLEDMVGPYKRSKFLAEQLAVTAASEGLPVVIVNPSTPVGPLDYKPTPTGRIILDFLNRRMPAYVDTGLNLAPVEDVARGHLLAAERGRIGEKYILGGENLTLAEMLGRLAQLSGPSRAPYPGYPTASR